MTLFIIGVLLLLGTHSVTIVAPQLRPAAVARLGVLGWQALYSLLSLLGFGLLVWGYAAVHPTSPVLYTPPAWTKHLALLLMLPVFPLLLATYLPGRIQIAVKHPMLLAVKIWAVTHLLVNGTLVDGMLFGSFLVWAIADRIALKRHAGPPVQGAPPHAWNDALAIGGGIGAYLLFLFWLHHALIGVAILP
ncbi:NnrU family protein [Chromatium okenii]|uniref:NnrU family protein n=1 Tax=Chromatium okenii TaxID=61644 RepID=UPI001906CA8A|nr:NnrU family protein [Chromatium okenii]MBK1640525.1 NnrU family protein [Chromatium okenii]